MSHLGFFLVLSSCSAIVIHPPSFQIKSLFSPIKATQPLFAGRALVRSPHPSPFGIPHLSSPLHLSSSPFPNGDTPHPSFYVSNHTSCRRYTDGSAAILTLIPSFLNGALFPLRVVGPLVSTICIYRLFTDNGDLAVNRLVGHQFVVPCFSHASHPSFSIPTPLVSLLVSLPIVSGTSLPFLHVQPYFNWLTCRRSTDPRY